MRTRRLVLIVLAVLVLVTGAFVFLTTAGLPLDPAKPLGDGRVTMVAEEMGPISIASYLVELDDGRYALVDAGMDRAAGKIVAALQARGRSATDVVAVFATHGHDDHTGGAAAFPQAKLYRMGTTLTDGGKVELGGVTVEAFAIPGHTADSAAFLARGVLFLGDSAGAGRNGSLGVNTLVFTDDGAQSVRSLQGLAARLADRHDEVRTIAFGHQGALDGLEPLTAWAAREAER